MLSSYQVRLNNSQSLFNFYASRVGGCFSFGRLAFIFMRKAATYISLYYIRVYSVYFTVLYRPLLYRLQASLHGHDDLNTLLQEERICKWLLPDSQIGNSGTLHFHSSTTHQLTFMASSAFQLLAEALTTTVQCDNHNVLAISHAWPWHTKTREHGYQLE